MPRFAANLAYVFTERPLIERFGAAAAAGFKAVELQYPYDHGPSAIRAEIERHGLVQLGINSPPRPNGGESGIGAVPGREREFVEVFQKALDYVVAIGGTAIHTMAGVVPPELRPAAERVFVANYARAADLAAEKNINVLIEPLNGRDRPNYFVTGSSRRRSDREDRTAECDDPVRFLSCADHLRRPAHPAGEIPVAHRPCADRRGAIARRTRRGRGELPRRCSMRSIGSATRAGSAASTSRVARPRMGWSGAAPSAWVARRKDRACNFSV